MKQIVIDKRKSRRGFWYTLECNLCHTTFDLAGFKFNEGKGKYCTLKCANSCPERIKNSIANRPDYFGESNPNYRGGHTMYTQYRKEACEHCKVTQVELDKRKIRKNLLEVHHIDWNRSNGSPNNLITLCVSCHRKVHPTNTNPRNKGRFT